jgi:RimJ/RimL family protein N-acetyltransferase
MTSPLESDRLRLRPLSWDDLPFLVELHADPEVARFVAHGRPRTEDETREWLTRTIAAQSEGLGHQGVMLKGDDRLIGRCGLTCFELEQGLSRPRAFWGRGSAPSGLSTVAVIELGYTFRRDCWGKGYASEAARCMRDQAFVTRGEPRVMSFIIEGNVASMRVADRIGMRQRGPIDIFGRPGCRYEMTRDEWRMLPAQVTSE